MYFNSDVQIRNSSLSRVRVGILVARYLIGNGYSIFSILKYGIKLQFITYVDYLVNNSNFY